MHNTSSSEVIEEEEDTITLFDGKKHIVVPCNDILFIKADHVYVEVQMVGGKQILLRSSLSELMEDLPMRQFVQPHRSYVINLDQVTEWDNVALYIQHERIPVSRSRRKIIQARLKTD